MKKFLISAALAGMVAQPAFAQSSGGNGQTQTTAANSQTNTSIVAIAGMQNTPADTHAEVDYGGHEWSTPGVQGSYFGGTNPCLVGTGGGAAGGPIGFNINLGRSDAACTRRSDAAAWHALGFDNIAIARMCQDNKNADAFFATTGLACPGTGASGRYKNPDGTPAAEMRLVSDARALPKELRTSSVDFSNPAIRQAVMKQAQLMAEQMVAQREQRQQFAQPTFTPEDLQSDAPVAASASAAVPASTGK